jgi:Fe-Mn family superoxide dismutase
MNVTFKNINSDISKQEKDLLKTFCKFLQKEYPLKDDLVIHLLGQREGRMTTGSQHKEKGIKILVNNRMNRDILRTLAHEWVHSHQRNVLGRKRGPDIGGQNEDEANSLAGSLIKTFEKENPDLENIIFEGLKPIQDKIQLLEEKILIQDKFNIQENFILEMKKIGIEKLPYSYSAMKQFVDPKTMNIHYNKHYKGYVKKLNDALKNKEGEMDLEDIIISINKFDDSVRNNAGGAFNHALFWKMLSPKKQIPKDEIFNKITEDFGNVKKMKDQFNEEAKKRFGSGWVWLVIGKNKKLKILSTPNQDNPLMNIVKDGGYPLLGLDLWEHAYYLKYQNKKDDYIKKFWNHVNWDFVNDLYKKKIEKKTLKESTVRKKVLNESKEVFPIKPKSFRLIINKAYPFCEGEFHPNGCLGKIQTDECQTEDGIIGGRFTEENYGGLGNWSIINRFDTNSAVHKEIQKIWVEETDGLENFRIWIMNNIDDLVGNDGRFTERLVNLNSQTIIDGRENENYAKSVLIQSFKLNPQEEGMTWQIKERCAGDIRDRKLGQDFDLIIENTSYFVQVKPVDVSKVEKIGSERGYYYKVPSWHNHTKYKEDNVDVILYVDRPNEKYIMFRNDYTRIQTVANPSTFPKFFVIYYENPISTNLSLDVILEPTKSESKPKLVRDVDKEIEYYKERIDYYKNKLRELGQSENINEIIKFYKKNLDQLITQ